MTKSKDTVTKLRLQYWFLDYYFTSELPVYKYALQKNLYFVTEQKLVHTGPRISTRAQLVATPA